MSKARELAELGAVYDSGALSNRNLIINGAMQVAQRGTSFTTVTDSTYTLDRFNYRKGNDGEVTITQDSSAPDGFSNSLKIDVTTADTSIAASQFAILEYNVEAQDLQRLAFGTSGAKNFTLSFYVKSNKTGTYAVNISQTDNSSKQATLTYTINSANTWERKSLTFTGDTSGVINDDNGIGFLMYWWLAAGSTFNSGSTSATFQTYSNANHAAGQAVNLLDDTSNEWLITGIQLEVGSEATPFEHRSFDEEFRRCSRYYQHSNSTGVKPTNGSNSTSFGTGYRALAAVNIWGGSTAGRVWEMVRDAPMRATPTATKFGNDSGYFACISHGSTSAPNSDNTVTFHENLMIRTEDACFISFDNQSSGNTVWGVMGGFELDAEL